MIEATKFGTDYRVAINPNAVFCITDEGESCLVQGTDEKTFIRVTEDFEEMVRWFDEYESYARKE